MNGFIICGKMTRSRTGIIGTRFNSFFSRLNMDSVVILLLLSEFYSLGPVPRLSGFFEQRPVDLAAADHFAGHDEFAEFALGRQVVHELEHEVFENHAQAAGADLALQGKFRDGFERVIGEAQAHILKFEQSLILTDEGVLRFRQNLHQRGLVQIAQNADDRQTAHEFGNQAVADQVGGLQPG